MCACACVFVLLPCDYCSFMTMESQHLIRARKMYSQITVEVETWGIELNCLFSPFCVNVAFFVSIFKKNCMLRIVLSLDLICFGERDDNGQ